MDSYLYIINLLMIMCLCGICSGSDMRDGIIHNKVLGGFAVAAIIWDVFYYGFTAERYVAVFLVNFLTAAIIAVILFYTHLFAGGDCKMLIVLAMMYPANCYFTYGNSRVTLVFAIGFALLAGYVYLFCNSLRLIFIKRTKISAAYIKRSVMTFLKSYASAMVYMSFLNEIIILGGAYGLTVNASIFRCLCLILAWCVGRYPIFRKKLMVIPFFAAVVIMALITKTIPVSFDWSSYILVLILLVCQIVIKTSVYEEISVDQLRKGMILSTMSSLMMQKSITKGLPGVSTEDLKSRLTPSEIESVRLWAKATHTKELTIVRKIPFAVFISIGFVCYFILWSVLI